jgi:hypothetical protein
MKLMLKMLLSTSTPLMPTLYLNNNNNNNLNLIEMVLVVTGRVGMEARERRGHHFDDKHTTQMCKELLKS